MSVLQLTKPRAFCKSWISTKRKEGCIERNTKETKKGNFQPEKEQKKKETSAMTSGISSQFSKKIKEKMYMCMHKKRISFWRKPRWSRKGIEKIKR